MVLSAIAVFSVNPAKASRRKGVLQVPGAPPEMLAEALAVRALQRHRAVVPARLLRALGGLRKAIASPVRHRLSRGAHSVCCFGRPVLRM